MANKYKRDFFAEAHQLLKQQGYRSYIQSLLPGGKWKGNEYVILNPTRNDTKPSSFSINCITGKWGDFATDKAGNDLIGLTSYIKGLSPLEACYHIGVPRPNKINLQEITIKNLKEDNIKTNQGSIEELPPLSQGILDELTVLTKEKEPTENNGLSSPSIAITNDAESQPQNFIPKFSEEFIGRRTKDRFKDGELTFYHYYSSKGIPVGCVVRCDKNIEGDKVKSFAQFSYDRIKERWQSSWSGEGKPLYNLQEIIRRADVPVMIVEGEKTAEVAKTLFPDYVITTCCMGSASPRSSNWSFLRNRDVIIAPDNDSIGAKYARTLNDILQRKEAKSIRGLDVKKLGRYTIAEGKPQQRDEPVPEKYDLADVAIDGWTADLIKEWKDHKDFAPFFEVVKDVQAIRDLPREEEECLHIEGVNYKLNTNTNTLWWEHVKQDKRSGEIINTWLPLSGYIKPTHCMEDVNGDHGFLAKIVTRKHKTVECFFSRDETATEKDTTKILLLKGLKIPHIKPANCYALNFYLNNFRPEFQAIGVDMVGWQGDNTSYMLPFVGDPRNRYTAIQKKEQSAEYILQQKGTCPRTLTKRGTLQEWKRTVGQVCRGNNLHTFAILVSLAAPALKLLNEEGGFFHYVGGTSIGKSTILHVAKSVWGFDNLGVFNSTSNALESICKNSNDGVLFLDEIGQVDADALALIIYMLTNGMTKSRANQSGEAKAVTFFKVLAQSTGEIGLEAKLAEKNKQVHGGQIVRMVELNADRQKGLNTFDILNINPDTGGVFKSGAEQAEYLKEHASKNSGVVIDEFLKQVVPNVDDYKESLKTAKAEWLKNKLTGTEGVEIVRVAKRFSTIFANAIIAQGAGILPFSTREIDECTNAMFDNWLERFGGDSPHELKTMIADLHKLTIENQYSRFQNAHPTEEERDNLPRDKAGYWQMGEGEEGNKVLKEFWIFPQVFEREILKGKDKKTFYPLLVKGGYIEKGGDGKNTQKKRPAKQDSQRFIVVPIAAFDEEIV
jgi:uncharacterized protein (DUF927 family)/5S rRNA maturation endonuclease (ribonuclease M5)